MDGPIINPSFDLIKNFQIGLIASIMTQPFQVLRTSSISEYKNTKGVIGIKRLGKLIGTIYRKQGVKGFFRGGALSVLKNGVGCTIFFTGLRNIDKKFQKIIPKKWSIQKPTRTSQSLLKGSLNFLSAGLSRTLTTILVSPILILKTRFQVIGKARTSILKETKKVYKMFGFRGFYKGLFPTLMRDGSLAGFQYSIYSFLLANLAFGSDNWLKNVIVPVIGGFSTALAVLLTFPFDNLRVRLQIQDSQTRSILQLIKYTILNEGFLGLYKGIVPRLLKKAFSGAVLWLIYQNVWNKETTLLPSA